MVTKIATGKSIQGILNYNENKVKEGTASLLLAQGFGSPIEKLSFHEKLTRFEKLTEKNKRAKTNALHFSLNFETSEKLHPDVLKDIARVYMEKIGFGNQPFLVYEHKDAAHPHVHIVTTNIQPSGKRIDIHNLGKNASEEARKEIEIDFNLIKAVGRGNLNVNILLPIPLEKAVYGKTETKRAISNIVREVTRSYKYTSLTELNAALGCYNVVADAGKAGAILTSKQGLSYSIINEKGEKLGVPIKSSSIYGKPTISFLEKQFTLNKILRKAQKQNLIERIDATFNSELIHSKESLKAKLQKEKIAVLYRENKEGKVYGITYVDHQNKTVFNGSDLGKLYSANMIMERLSAAHLDQRFIEASKNPERQTDNEKYFPSVLPADAEKSSSISSSISTDIETLVGELLNAKEANFDFVPSEFSKRKRRKRKKRTL